MGPQGCVAHWAAHKGRKLEQLRRKSDRKGKIYKSQGFGISSREGIRRKEEKDFRARTFHFMQSNEGI